MGTYPIEFRNGAQNFPHPPMATSMVARLDGERWGGGEGGVETTGNEQRKLQVGLVMGHFQHYPINGLGKTMKSKKGSLEAKHLL